MYKDCRVRVVIARVGSAVIGLMRSRNCTSVISTSNQDPQSFEQDDLE